MSIMSRFRLLLALGCLLGSMGTQVLAADYVVAAIDPDRIVERSPQYEQARNELQQAVADREKKLREQQEELTALQARLDRDAALMSTEEAQRLSNDIRNRDRKLKYAQGEAREDLTLRQNEMRTKLGKQVEEVVTELAKQRGIDLIVSGKDVFYFSERIDISDEVVERMRAKHQAK
ncbi:MAG: OmpH family outer membrane protein [Chromatiaceae bacterium]|nr:OmpH family outer membrane protein [Chromatiaceae bacterium]